MTEGSGLFVVPADHPALAGHFPDNPIVPGVVLLEQALAMLPAGRRLARVDSVKFHASLMPGINCTVRWRDVANTTRLTCEVEGNLLAEANVTWRTAGSSP
jgi:3-hydroxyacyl-[acyl-carrier-protein] dehydratase